MLGHAYSLIISSAILVITVTALPPPAWAQARVLETAILRWSIIETPGSVSDKNDIRSNSEVNSIVVASDGKTIYTIDIPRATPPPAPNPGIWKSSDNGISFSPKTTRHLTEAIPGPFLPVMDIAVAPDDPNFLTAVCLNNLGTLRHEVYLSDDGGSTWIYTGAIPWVYGGGEQIGDIAISTGYSCSEITVHDIIIGSRHPNDAAADGEIYIRCYPGFNGWRAQGFSLGDVIAVRPSPNYTTDFSLVVMAATTQRTYLSLGYRDTAANNCTWNTDNGWPVEMCEPSQGGGSTSGEDRIITGDIALPANFIGTIENQRLIFTTYDSAGTALGPSQVLDDVYRLNNTVVTRLRLPGAGISARVSTIAYTGDNEAGKLIAGEVAANLAQASARVWICLDPLKLCPTWKLSLKPPTGGGKDGYANAQLAWSADGSTAYCATGCGNRDTPQKWANPADPAWNSQSLDESAVSISLDEGESWNQIGLIDTQIDRLRSVAAAEDETTVYLASVNEIGFDSLWRSESQVLGNVWQRVLCFSGESSILRLAPDAKDGSYIFWGDQGTDQARSSTDRGQTWLDCLPHIIIEDMAAPNSQKLYILQGNGGIRRGSYAGGWTWGKIMDTGLNTGHTIAVHNDYILVGASANELSPVAYSADDGQTWLKITTQTPSIGNRHTAFDTYFDTNQIIYVADDAGGIYRWSLGRSYVWDDMAPPNHSFYSIHLGSGGALYGAFSSPDSGVDRTLYPRSGIPKPGVYWDTITVGLGTNVRFSTEPDSMSISENTLWAIDARAYDPVHGVGCLWAFIDTLAGAGLRLIEPAYGTAIGCDPVSGRNQEVSLGWQQLSLADAYEVEIAKDEDFSLRITEAEPITNPYYGPPVVTQPAYRILPAMLPEANTTYYWRVRVRQAATGQVIRSYWSEAGSFSIKAGLPVVSPYLGAQALNPEHGANDIPASFVAFSWTPFKDATEYQFILAKDSALTEIIVQESLPTTAYRYSGRLDYETPYFWQVIAIEPLPSEPSPVFSFITTSRPSPPPEIPPLYNQLLQWLQISVLINVLGFVTIAAVMILSRSRRI
ncbi:MAG: hypothetical protein MUO89_08605 [Dehalococcoidia bacterium]|nr:hypothetical protein [Dehalococcoidia bacterium]